MTIWEITLLGVVASLVVAGGVLLWCRKAPAACAAIGAAVGIFAVLCLFHFRVAVSRTRHFDQARPAVDAMIFFEPIWQQGGATLLQYDDADEAEAVANLLNCALGVVGGVAGIAIGLGACRLFAKRRVAE